MPDTQPPTDPPPTDTPDIPDIPDTVRAWYAGLGRKTSEAKTQAARENARRPRPGRKKKGGGK